VYECRGKKRNKTQRCELTAVERAVCCGEAIVGGASLRDILGYFPSRLTKSGTQELQSQVFLSQTRIFTEHEPGRGRPELLSPEQKHPIIAIDSHTGVFSKSLAWGSESHLRRFSLIIIGALNTV
jgi:hypothetical protein